MENCCFCNAPLGIDWIQSAGGGFRHYSRIDCADNLLSQRKELLESLQNMTGLFGEASTRHIIGKAFGDLHKEVVAGAKRLLEKYS